MMSSHPLILAASLEQILSSELAAATPFRVTTLMIFFLAIVHMMFANRFTLLSKRIAKKHFEKTGKEMCFLAEITYFLGEIELVFALWVIPLVLVISAFFGWQDVVKYLDSRIYVEPFFIVVIMSLASTRPIIQAAEKGAKTLANFFGGSSASYWLVVMTLTPLLGSLITEAAALTIAAFLVIHHLYSRSPTKRLAYGTLGLMFVNFSVGGILTNFAAPPALILSRCWNWSSWDFFKVFSTRVILGIAIVNALYYFWLRRDFLLLKEPLSEKQDKEETVPIWVTAIHGAFIVWTILMAHYPPIFLGGYLLFLGFHQATRIYQYRLNLKRPLLVGLFLAGLVIHGELQGWWIEPLIGNLEYGGMLLTATVLTAFNENSTVAYLSCLVDSLPLKLQYALASGLVAGGGLTFIAHAPNPGGRSLLNPYFKGGISPWSLFLWALPATLIFFALFYLLPP